MIKCGQRGLPWQRLAILDISLAQQKKGCQTYLIGLYIKTYISRQAGTRSRTKRITSTRSISRTKPYSYRVNPNYKRQVRQTQTALKSKSRLSHWQITPLHIVFAFEIASIHAWRYLRALSSLWHPQCWASRPKSYSVPFYSSRIIVGNECSSIIYLQENTLDMSRCMCRFQ